jgi:hypothetical protein
MPDLGNLRRVELRQAWENEALHFTPWLAENLSLLGQAIGIELELLEREAEVGDFSVDILASDVARGRKVIIENQLEATDHGHLGQLLTYAAGTGAGVVVWICSAFREEHRQAIDWLNKGFSAGTDFFGVVLELLAVDESRPAVHFRVVASPNDWSRRSSSAAAAAEELSPKRAAYQAFFQTLIDRLRAERFTNARVAQPNNWCSFASGTRGITYGVVFTGSGTLRAEVYIDAGDRETNLRVLTALKADAAAITAELAETLQWDELEGRRACRIGCETPADPLDADKREHHLAWAIDHMRKFKRVFALRLAGAVATAGGDHTEAISAAE